MTTVSDKAKTKTRVKAQCKVSGCVRVTYRPDRLCNVCAIVKGKGKPNVSADLAREVLSDLSRSGWTDKNICYATGLTTRALGYIRAGKTKFCRYETLAALRVLTTHDVVGRKLVPVWPARRRLQSLCAIGVTVADLVRFLDVPRSTLYNIMCRDSFNGRVDRDVADKICELFDQLAYKPVSSPVKLALNNNWVPPMWWDDIDNPKEIPGVSHCFRCHSSRVKHMGYCKPCSNISSS